jgi:mercuric ion transport protein
MEDSDGADDSHMPSGRRGDCRDCGDGAAQSAENRGLAWVIGAFVICPCHLPLTLTLAAALLGGTAAGAALRGHPFIAGAIITLAWVAATWHGFRLMRRAGDV